MSHTNVPELDASAQRFNIRMYEGDAPNFSWIVPTFSGWAGTYEFRVLLDDDSVLLLDNTVIASGADALFTVVDVAQPDLVAKSSGYPWEIEDTGDVQTRFAGLLFVDPAVIP